MLFPAAMLLLGTFISATFPSSPLSLPHHRAKSRTGIWVENSTNFAHLPGRQQRQETAVLLIPIPFVRRGLLSPPRTLISPPGFKATLITSITRLALARRAPGCHRTSCAGICSSEGPSDLEGTIHIHSHRFK